MKKRTLKELKSFLKMYLYSLTASVITLTAVDLYAYKDNIYYHNEIKLSDKEIEEMEELVSETVGEEITINNNSIVLDAVIENENLTESEKEFIYSYKNLLEDNPYLDKTNAYNNLKKLDIIYDKNADYGKDVMGVYINTDNEITIIEDTPEKGTISHEVIHCIYSHRYIKRLPRFFNEGMTEILANEYFSKNPFKETTSYPYEITMVKILCEIVGEDKVLEAYSKEDMTIVEEELRNKTNISEPKEIIERMESTTTALQNNEKIDAEKVRDIIVFLDRYYENIDNNSIEYEMYLYNKNIVKGLYDKTPNIKYICNIVENGYYIKPYFSEELKDKYNNPYHIDYYEDIEGNNDTKKYVKNNDIISI